MLATLRAVPSHGEGAAVEWKSHGQRAAVVVEADGTYVVSRSGADVSSLGLVYVPRRRRFNNALVRNCARS
jgi:ATP-dependent DNA ligase